MLKIRSGPYEVLHSGTVIGFSAHPIELRIGPDDASLTFRLHFIDKDFPPEKEGTVEWKRPDDTSLEASFFQSKQNPLGYGNAEAAHVGTFQNKKLYFYYRIYTLGNRPERLVHYTFYSGEEVANG